MITICQLPVATDISLVSRLIEPSFEVQGLLCPAREETHIATHIVIVAWPSRAWPLSTNW